MFDQNDFDFVITNKTNDMEKVLEKSKVMMNYKGVNVTVGYIEMARQRSKPNKLYYGDIILDNKFDYLSNIKIIKQECDFENQLVNNRGRVINVTTYIDGE